MSDPPRRGRRGARRAAVQAIYQWQMTGQDPGEILVQFEDDLAPRQVDLELFSALVRGVPEAVGDLDARLQPLLDREVARVDPVERAILRIATYELIHFPEVPWRVVIDEAVNLAHTFGAESSHRYVNGVLDALARKVRTGEVAGTVE